MKTMNYFKLSLAAAIILALFLASCSKDDEDKLSRTEMLARNWKITSVDDYAVKDYLGVDYIYLRFEQDGDLNFTVSYEGSSVTLVYTWSWIDNEQTIAIDDGFSEMEWHVLKLNEKDLWFIDTSDQSTFKCYAD
jgi:hypothetical protein